MRFLLASSLGFSYNIERNGDQFLAFMTNSYAISCTKPSKQANHQLNMPYYFSRSPIKFQGHTGWKIYDLNQIWLRILGRSQLSNPSDLPCYLSDFHVSNSASFLPSTHVLYFFRSRNLDAFYSNDCFICTNGDIGLTDLFYYIDPFFWSNDTQQSKISRSSLLIVKWDTGVNRITCRCSFTNRHWTLVLDKPT